MSGIFFSQKLSVFRRSRYFSRKSGKIRFSEKAEKVYKSVEKYNNKCKSLIFFSVFGIHIFTILVYPKLKVQIYCWNISFCDPHIEGMPKSAINIEFP